MRHVGLQTYPAFVTDCAMFEEFAIVCPTRSTLLKLAWVNGSEKIAQRFVKKKRKRRPLETSLDVIKNVSPTSTMSQQNIHFVNSLFSSHFARQRSPRSVSATSFLAPRRGRRAKYFMMLFLI